ncbi:TPA: hypothetical protein RQK84_004359 [Vibrio vulnificus]|nr:hypothetical protein [Vibrio vulnificus]HDY8016231.1 hypothetical protein [Vibrio vulnificus]
MNNRDDFTKDTRDLLAKRVSYKCSNPSCCVFTVGAKDGDATKVASIGVAAHITAAAPGGPRYNANITSAQRKYIHNGIWLCQSCSTIIDRDEIKYTVELLYSWKSTAESNANSRIGVYQNISNNDALFHQTESSRVEKFINFIYELFYEYELGKGSLSTDAYYVDKNVFHRVLNIGDYSQKYKQDLRSYNESVRQKQDVIMDIIFRFQEFIQGNNYNELAYSYKLVEDCQYYYSQELQGRVAEVKCQLEMLAKLVIELHQFREWR